MLMKYSIKEIATVLRINHSALAAPKAVISSLLTDSRSLTYPDETLFFAIRTQNNDGHHYITSLYEKGVRNFVIESDSAIQFELPDANFLLVADSGKALQEIAAYHRRRFDCPVIGITVS